MSGWLLWAVLVGVICFGLTPVRVQVLEKGPNLRKAPFHAYERGLFAGSSLFRGTGRRPRPKQHRPRGDLVCALHNARLELHVAEAWHARVDVVSARTAWIQADARHLGANLDGATAAA